MVNRLMRDYQAVRQSKEILHTAIALDIINRQAGNVTLADIAKLHSIKKEKANVER